MLLRSGVRWLPAQTRLLGRPCFPEKADDIGRGTTKKTQQRDQENRGLNECIKKSGVTRLQPGTVATNGGTLPPARC